jgi:hypothetical protein
VLDSGYLSPKKREAGRAGRRGRSKNGKIEEEERFR